MMHCAVSKRFLIVPTLLFCSCASFLMLPYAASSESARTLVPGELVKGMEAGRANMRDLVPAKFYLEWKNPGRNPDPSHWLEALLVADIPRHRRILALVRSSCRPGVSTRQPNLMLLVSCEKN